MQSQHHQLYLMKDGECHGYIVMLFAATLHLCFGAVCLWLDLVTACAFETELADASYRRFGCAHSHRGNLPHILSLFGARWSQISAKRLQLWRSDVATTKRRLGGDAKCSVHLAWPFPLFGMNAGQVPSPPSHLENSSSDSFRVFGFGQGWRLACFYAFHCLG